LLLFLPAKVTQAIEADPLVIAVVCAASAKLTPHSDHE
jgi:hypothetical protein